MLLNTIAVLLATASTAVTAASIPQARDDTPAGLHVIDVQTLDGGKVMTWYAADGDEEANLAGLANTSPNTPGDSVLSKRCGSNQVECHSSNHAQTPVCADLINQIGNNGNTQATSPRSICMEWPRYGRCCVSWSVNAPGARTNYFYSAAQKTLSTCERGANGVILSSVSGKSKDTNIGGVCLTQCLSNRPDGCN